MSIKIYVNTEKAPFFVNNIMGYGESEPMTGNYKVGDFIVSSIQTDNVFGWVCTESGEPGIWKAITIGSGNNGSSEGIGDLGLLETNNKDNLVSAINEVFQSGVNVKDNMVQAINSKKTVSDVSNSDTWDTITQRVNDIKEGSGNATVNDVLSGKTFTNDDGIEYTGSLNIGGTAVAADVLSGKTFTNSTKSIITGTMVNRGGAQTVTPGTANKVLNSGYYSGNITVAGDANLVAANIVSGKSIFGVAGTFNARIMPDWYDYGDLYLYSADMTTGRERLTASAVGTNIYCIGGYYSSNNYTMYNQSYSILTNKWTSKANMPTGRSILGSASLGTNIYCIGGLRMGTSGSTYLTKNECYDTTTDTWTTKASLPLERGGLKTNIVGTNIYCIGGVNLSSSYHTTNYCYNTTTDTWSTKASLPTKRSGMCSSVVGTNIYCMGGTVTTSSTTYYDINECYNSLTNSWSTKASGGGKRHSAVSESVGNDIYVIHGTSSTANYLSSNNSYNIITNSWTNNADASIGRRYLASSVIGKNIYCIGGSNSSNYLKSNYCYVVK